MAEKISDHIGHFLIELFHKGYFGYDELIPKEKVRQEFKNYLKNNNLLEYPEYQEKVETLLRKYGYLLHTEKGSNLFKIKRTTFSNFYSNILREMDDKQIKNSTLHILPENLSTEKKKNLEINPNDDEKSLLYQGGEIQCNINENFCVTNMGCFICQRNFSYEESFESHIEYHGEASGFKSIRNYSNTISDFELSYRTCKNNYLLYFTMKTNQEDLIIEKIIIIRARWMNYVRNEHVPFEMPKNGIDHFLIDSHLFNVGVPQPIVLIYKHKNDSSKRNVAQYLFVRNEEFPIVKMKLKSTRVISRDEMKNLQRLPFYFPSTEIKNLCDNNDLDCDTLSSIFPKMKEYLENSKELRVSSMIDVLRLLLHIEDIKKCNKYKRLNRNNCKINGYCDEYSVGIKNLTPDICVTDILNPFDEITLIECENENTDNGNRGGENGKRKKPKQINCYIYRANNTEVFFKPRDRSKTISLNKKYKISFSPGRIPIIFQFRALEILQRKEDIRRILFPTINFNKTPVNLSLDFYNKRIGINPEQEQAVMNIVDGSNKSIPYIIFGPPGTGKTTTIVESVLQLWKTDKNNRILVTAGSNTACDEVAQKLCEIFNEIDEEGLNLLRIYAAAVEKRIDNMDENLLEASNLCHNYHFYPSIESIKSYRIIVATLTVVGKLVQGKISEKFFTHIFIDECAASTEPEALVGIAGIMSLDTKLILSGDPKQLGPILESEKAAELGLSLSLLERLLNRACYKVNLETGEYDRTIQTRLIRNFRTHSKILFLSNSLYYDSTLICCAKREITDWALGWHRLPSKHFPIIFNVVYGQTERMIDSRSLCNYKELSVTMDYVKNLMFFGIKERKITENDIGIISPYKKQCSLIREELDKRGWFKIETGSVETFQGKEKPIIIISMVRSDTPHVGFLNNPKRTNVALTRAQALLIIVGNPETLEKINDWRQVIEYCRDNNAFAGAKYPRQMSNFRTSQSNLSTITGTSKSLKQEVVIDKEKNKKPTRRSHSRNHNRKRFNAVKNTNDRSDCISLGSNLEESVTNWLKENEKFREKLGIMTKSSSRTSSLDNFENIGISEQKTDTFETIQDDDDDDELNFFNDEIVKSTKNSATQKISPFEILHDDFHNSNSNRNDFDNDLIDLDEKSSQFMTEVSKPKAIHFNVIHNDESVENVFDENLNPTSGLNLFNDKTMSSQKTILKDEINPFKIIHDDISSKGAVRKNLNSRNDFNNDFIDLNRDRSHSFINVSESEGSSIKIIHDDVTLGSSTSFKKNLKSGNDFSDDLLDLTKNNSQQRMTSISSDPITINSNKIIHDDNINLEVAFKKNSNSRNNDSDDDRVNNLIKETKQHLTNIKDHSLYRDSDQFKNDKKSMNVINNLIPEDKGFEIRPHAPKVTLPDQPIRSTTMIRPFETSVPMNDIITYEEIDSPRLVEQCSRNFDLNFIPFPRLNQMKATDQINSSARKNSISTSSNKPKNGKCMIS